MSLLFRTFFDHHYDSLCALAYRILRDREAAREVVQQIFIDLWRKGSWENLQSPKAYLYVAVYRRCLDEIAARKRFVSDNQIPEGFSSPEDFQTAELEKIIITGIESLPEQCQRIFVLSREQDLTYKEIAAELNLSVKTVERQMGIALKKLREHLDKHWK